MRFELARELQTQRKKGREGLNAFSNLLASCLYVTYAKDQKIPTVKCVLSIGSYIGSRLWTTTKGLANVMIWFIPGKM